MGNFEFIVGTNCASDEGNGLEVYIILYIIFLMLFFKIYKFKFECDTMEILEKAKEISSVIDPIQLKYNIFFILDRLPQ